MVLNVFHEIFHSLQVTSTVLQMKNMALDSRSSLKLNIYRIRGSNHMACHSINFCFPTNPSWSKAPSTHCNYQRTLTFGTECNHPPRSYVGPVKGFKHLRRGLQLCVKNSAHKVNPNCEGCAKTSVCSGLQCAAFW